MEKTFDQLMEGWRISRQFFENSIAVTTVHDIERIDLQNKADQLEEYLKSIGISVRTHPYLHTSGILIVFHELQDAMAFKLSFM